MAILGALVTVILNVDVTVHTFLSGLQLFFNPMDVFVGIAKTMVFGATVAITGAHFGFEQKAVQKEWEMPTKAVVTSAVLILVLISLLHCFFCNNHRLCKRDGKV